MRVGFEGSQDHDLALRVVEKARRVGPSAAHSLSLARSAELDRRIGRCQALQLRCRNPGGDRGVGAARGAGRGGSTGLGGRGQGEPARAIAFPTTARAWRSSSRRAISGTCSNAVSRRSRGHGTAISRSRSSTTHSDDPETIAWLDIVPGPRAAHAGSARAGFNFAAIHNHAAREVDAEYLLFLNNDTEVINPAWLSQMVGFARLDGVGAVGARLLFPNDTVQHAGILHGFNQGSLALAFRGLPREQPGYLAAARVCRNYGAVTAACMLTPRRLFLELGGFDEQNFAVSFNDVDYCYRLVDRGYRCVYAAEAELYHHEGATRGIGSRVDEIARFRQRYGHRAEPYYNPNLSTTSEHFEVRPRRLARRADRPVRALLTCHTLDLTGAPFCQFEMAAALRAKDRLDPIVISPEDGPLRSLYEECGIPVRILPHAFDKVGVDRRLRARARGLRAACSGCGCRGGLRQHAEDPFRDRRGAPARPAEPLEHPRERAVADLLQLPARRVAARALQCFAYPYRVLFVSNASRAVFETAQQPAQLPGDSRRARSREVGSPTGAAGPASQRAKSWVSIPTSGSRSCSAPSASGRVSTTWSRRWRSSRRSSPAACAASSSVTVPVTTVASWPASSTIFPQRCAAASTWCPRRAMSRSTTSPPTSSSAARAWRAIRG